jgi:RNA polymerase II subunit A-like phosphatase
LRYLHYFLLCSTDDFFVGIGDINSAFLPKLEPLTAASTSLPTSKPSETANGGSPSPVIVPEHTGAVDATVVGSTVPDEAESAKTATTKALMTRNNAALEAQLEERPLAKKQEALREHELHPDGPGVPAKKTPSPEPEKVPKKPLLKNDDGELDRVGKVRDSG